MEFFLKYKIVILRAAGVLMLVIGFSIHFWVTPKDVLSENDKAAARIARIEAKVKGNNSQNSKQPAKKDNAKFLKKMQDTQTKQMQYLTIIAMILGVGFLGYSFVPKKEEDA